LFAPYEEGFEEVVEADGDSFRSWSGENLMPPVRGVEEDVTFLVKEKRRMKR